MSQHHGRRAAGWLRPSTWRGVALILSDAYESAAAFAVVALVLLGVNAHAVRAGAGPSASRAEVAGDSG